MVQDWREKKDIYVYLLGNYLTENQKFIDEDEDKGTEKCRKECGVFFLQFCNFLENM